MPDDTEQTPEQVIAMCKHTGGFDKRNHCKVCGELPECPLCRERITELNYPTCLPWHVTCHEEDLGFTDNETPETLEGYEEYEWE